MKITNINLLKTLLVLILVFQASVPTYPNYPINRSSLRSCLYKGINRLFASGGKTRYVSLDILVVVFTDVVHEGKRYELLGVDLNKVYKELEKARMFYWVNSHCKLNLNFTYLITNASVRFSGWWLGPEIVEPFLETALDPIGQKPENYDGLIVMWASPGYSSEDDPPGSVGGSGGTVYRYSSFEIGGAICWLAVHEFHHQLDEFFHESGHPEYRFNHPREGGAEDLGDYGEHFDVNAYILRIWPVEDWLELKELPQFSPKTVETDDVDQDGIPDDDLNTPIDEVRFGSSPRFVDTDGDGLTDLEELMAGIYSSSDPKNIDTDGDGVIDGLDTYPLYPLNPWIPKRSIQIDGRLETEWHLLSYQFAYINADFKGNISLSWDDEYLYIGMESDDLATIYIYIDANNDGWFHGKDNYEIVVGPSKAGATYEIEGARVWDCSGTNARLVWDEEIISKEDIKIACGEAEGEHVLEMAIPKNIETGLSLKEGSEIGLRFEFHSISGDDKLWGTVFERYSFVDIKLGEKPQIYLVKKVSSSYALTDEEFNITLMLFNVGDTAVYNINVTDSIDESIFEMVSGNTTAFYQEVPPRTARVLTYTLKTPKSISGTLTLPGATARYEYENEKQGVESNQIYIHVNSALFDRPLILVHKTISLDTEKQLVVRTTLTNIGGSPAINVKLTDVINESLFTLLSGSTNASYSQVAPGMNVSVRYILRALEPGTYRLCSPSVEYQDTQGKKYETEDSRTIIIVIRPTEQVPITHYIAMYVIYAVMIFIPLIIIVLLVRMSIHERRKLTASVQKN